VTKLCRFAAHVYGDDVYVTSKVRESIIQSIYYGMSVHVQLNMPLQ